MDNVGGDRWIDGIGAVAAALLVLGGFTVSEAHGQWARHTVDSTSQGADGVRLADVNQDGHQDVTTAWEEGGAVRVYMNPGPSRVAEPWPRVTVGNVSSGEDAVFADLDADGATDVVSSTEGDEQTLYVHWAPEDPERYLHGDAWTTEPIPVTQGTQKWMFALPMEIGEGLGPDLILGSKGDAATVGMLPASGSPRPLSNWQYHPLYDAGWIMTLRDVDMDGDGDRDVLVSDRYGNHPGVLWLERPDSSPTDPAAWVTHRVGPRIEALFIDRADVNGDGRPDVLATERPHKLHLLLRSSDGWRSETITYDESRFGTAKSIRGVDLDQDGEMELLVTCEKAEGPKSGVFFLEERGGTWEAQDIGGPEGVKFDRTELLDLDGDGDLDVLTCEERDQLGVIWYENPSR